MGSREVVEDGLVSSSSAMKTVPWIDAGETEDAFDSEVWMAPDDIGAPGPPSLDVVFGRLPRDWAATDARYSFINGYFSAFRRAADVMRPFAVAPSEVGMLFV